MAERRAQRRAVRGEGGAESVRTPRGWSVGVDMRAVSAPVSVNTGVCEVLSAERARRLGEGCMAVLMSFREKVGSLRRVGFLFPT